MSPPLPARAGAWLLERLLPARHRDAVIGDLVEEYALRLQAEHPAAVARWYRAQLMKSLPRVAAARLAAGQWHLTIGIALAALAGVTAVETGLNYLIHAAVPMSSGAAMLVSLVVAIASLVAGGYFAACFRVAAAVALAFAQAMIVLGFMLLDGEDYPLWSQIVFLILCPAATLAGGILYLRGRRKDGQPAG